MEFVDLHSHFAWGIDDGIANIEEAKLALAKAKVQKIKQIVVTPHIIPGTTTNIGAIKKRIKEFIELAKNYDIKAYCGSEVMLNSDCLTTLKENSLILLNDGPYLLVEFNLLQAINEDSQDRLYEYSLKHKIVIAHVERYFYKSLDIPIIQSWINNGYIIQVNSSSFLGENGTKIKNNAYKLLEKGLIHIIASDTHRATKHRFPNLEDTYHLLTKKYSSEQIKQLMYDNPLAIIKGEEVSLVEVKKIPWFKRRT